MPAHMATTAYNCMDTSTSAPRNTSEAASRSCTSGSDVRCRLGITWTSYAGRSGSRLADTVSRAGLELCGAGVGGRERANQLASP